MRIFRKIHMTVTRITQILFYKIIYNNRIIFNSGFRSRGRFHFFLEKNAKVILGKNIFLNRDFSASIVESLIIGDNCIFGENVKIYDQNHIFKDKDKPIAQQGFNVKNVCIGRNCWIASNVTILKGVTIGDNVIIGANCLIYKDIPSNSIVTLNESLNIVKRG
ncbi:acyltransferase [Limosilactobacillus reuteri]|uniref:Acyltransferase n=1 Tax=Limosilactobacillus reuteri TaxID=1598 RepID=A0ABD6X9R3_LIMRT|nr:acyltransferase [Limosilactobacillus reuteri]PTM26756.1 acyltransferase [Limosilactobacillus reuteri]PTM26994.1 acyltransferase [Limosilactobacillus reuteri]